MLILNSIQSKVAKLKCVNTYFLTESLIPRLELEETASKNLTHFKLDGKIFFISHPTNPNSYMQEEYTIFAQASENIWVESIVYLYEWEWLYITLGHNKVNEREYFVCRAIDVVKPYYLSKSQYLMELEKCGDKAESETERFSMINAINRKTKRVMMNQDGQWVEVLDQVHLLPNTTIQENTILKSLIALENK